jgi:hypothetical protein
MIPTYEGITHSTDFSGHPCQSLSHVVILPVPIRKIKTKQLLFSYALVVCDLG